MLKPRKISSLQAQLLVLKASGPQYIYSNTLEIIKKLGHIQIDTISVVERAHHHILWTRNTQYRHTELEELLEQKKIFEYWSHAASYLPMENFRFYLPRMRQYQEGKKHWFKTDKKIQKMVLDKIKSEGPLMSKDFDHPKKNAGWFEWKPAKKALEQLFMAGKLMVCKRQGFQKIYDLTENVLPSWVDTSMPSDEELYNFFLQKNLQSLGVASLEQLSYLRGAEFKTGIQKAITRFQKAGSIQRVLISGLEKKYYATAENLSTESMDNLNKNSNDYYKEAYLLSPFDNLVIQRKRLKELFQFDYQVECYLPEKKRKFGYFCLPILLGNNLVGRIDLKAHREQKILIIKNQFFEKKVSFKDKKLITKKLEEYAHFLGLQKIEKNSSDRRHL